MAIKDGDSVVIHKAFRAGRHPPIESANQGVLFQNLDEHLSRIMARNFKIPKGTAIKVIVTSGSGGNTLNQKFGKAVAHLNGGVDEKNRILGENLRL